MKRFKLICIGIVLAMAIAMFCSFRCVERSQFSVRRVYVDRENHIEIFVVNTPRSSQYVLFEKVKGGVCVLR